MNIEIEKILKDFNPGHDHIQLQYFILGQGITDYGKYHQAQAELWSRTNEIKSLKRDLIRKQLSLDSLEIAPIDPRLIVLEREEINDAIFGINKAIDRLEHEVAIILPLAQSYAKSIEGQDESKLIEEYQFERLKKLLMLNTVFRGGNLSGVLDTILTLPPESQQRLIEEYREMNIKTLKDYKDWEKKALE